MNELRSWSWLVWAFGVALCLAAVAMLSFAGCRCGCEMYDTGIV